MNLVYLAKASVQDAAAVEAYLSTAETGAEPYFPAIQANLEFLSTRFR
jgi:hypothetical protein